MKDCLFSGNKIVEDVVVEDVVIEDVVCRRRGVEDVGRRRGWSKTWSC
jgi:hypothetical protein